MPKTHVVEQGECLTTIARQYGFADGKAIYEDGANSAFREKRKNPDVIFPGDEIVIPEKKPKSVSCAPEQTHKFKVTLPRRKLKLKLRDISGEPIKDVPYKLHVGALEIEGKTTGEGLIEKDLPADARTARLVMNGVTRTLKIGELNPMKHTEDGGVTGVQARLQNLGYDPGPVDGVLGPRTRAAIRAFQRAQGAKEPDGKIGEALFDALEKAHGS